ncbi:amidohydrolase [Acinetobacter sp. ANC 4910]|uniref:amidohydrolase n=1 Tax=Acinetobacter sp. ANC 4910 TaxID=2529850 RepID=UPI00103F6D35|nr:amidohydrolase [Acinetobacter sp. ANC 4910]TCB37537.1 amidohydrolase [Acinetobacter sp. ANC 4910]
MKKILLTLPIVGALAACSTTPTQNIPTNSQLYFNGDIVTMVGDKPQYAQAVLVENGKIAFVGDLAAAKNMAPNSRQINLEGKTLLPGFIDAHGHAYNAGFQALASNLLAPPDGKVTDINSLIQNLNQWKADNKNIVGKYKWIIGFGYDDAQLKEQRHPTADDLDKISKDEPVLVIHQSGHLGAMNHKALELVGYNASTKDPDGGVIRRVKNSKEPNGVLEEMAFFQPLFSMMAKYDKDANKKIALAGVKSYLRFGYTTLQEGRATSDACETWKSLGQQNLLKVDVACYPDIQAQLPYLESEGVQKSYLNHFRIAGVKLSLDGSPQGRTAWLTKPYLTPPEGQSKTYVGYPAIPQESKVDKLVATAYEHNWQILAHTNGDAALDEYLTAVDKAAKKYGNDDRRTVAIHAQTARDDQLDSMKKLKIIPSFFAMHTYYWGDWHRDVTLGKERAYRISPGQTALNKGMIFTQHHDAPVALPNSIMILYATVNRISRSGDVIGPAERVSPYNALRSITSWAAYQYFEEDSKGTLEKGKLADLVVLDKNPLKVDPKTIKDIQVLQTIKEGNVVYQK